MPSSLATERLEPASPAGVNTGRYLGARFALVVEDENLVRSLISSVLEGQGFIVSQAASVSAALREIDTREPDFALIDLNLGDGPSGADLAQVLRTKYPEIGVLILTKSPDLRAAKGTSQNIPGGCGFVRKESVGDVNYLLECIELVLADHSSELRQDRDPSRGFANLTGRQVELLRQVALGYTNLEISSRLGVSLKSVEQRLTLLIRTLNAGNTEGVNPRAELMRLYIEQAGLPARD